MSEFEYDFLSLVLATVGLFFICCATVQKKPKHILEEAFGLYRGGLRDLKSSVFKRNQVVMGFLCVVLAIVANIFGTSTADSGGMLSGFGAISLVAILIASMAALGGVLNYFSRLWSKSAFRQLISEVVSESAWPLEENMPMVREIGKLLGLPPSQEDTVEGYVQRLRAHLDLPPVDIHPVSGAARSVSRLSRVT